MGGDLFIRRVLYTAAVFNLGGALLFAFPGSVGRLAGLPSPVPAVYAALLVLFILLFGGAYAWVAAQPVIHRPIVGLSAIGKAAAFAVVFVCWLLGEVPGRSVLAIAGDRVFAGLFAWWLVSGPEATGTKEANEPT